MLSATRQRWLPSLHPNRAGWYSIYRPRKDERLSWPSWLVTYWNGLPVHRRPSVGRVHHLGTNRIWRCATMLIEANALPLSQTATTKPNCQRCVPVCLQTAWLVAMCADCVLCCLMNRQLDSTKLSIIRRMCGYTLIKERSIQNWENCWDSNQSVSWLRKVDFEMV